MSTNDPVDSGTPQPRRIVMRRSRGGGSFSSGISTRSESLRDAEPDEVDEAIDPDLVRDNIRNGGVEPPRAPSQDAERDNPRRRLNQVMLAGSQNYAKEYRLQLLHRLLMRNVPLDQIAQQLQVSISTVEKDRAELKKRLREAAKELNIEEMVGGQNAVYDEIAGMALRVASGGAARDENGNAVQAIPTSMRLAAMRTALAANADKTRFNATAGVFDVLRFRRADDGSNISDVQHLMSRTMEMLEALNASDVDTVVPSPIAPVAPHGGFAPMSFNDLDASGSANEIQEL